MKHDALGRVALRIDVIVHDIELLLGDPRKLDADSHSHIRLLSLRCAGVLLVVAESLSVFDGWFVERSSGFAVGSDAFYVARGDRSLSGGLDGHLLRPFERGSVFALPELPQPSQDPHRGENSRLVLRKTDDTPTPSLGRFQHF